MWTFPEPYRFTRLESRSITAGNPTGGKGTATTGWKHAIGRIRPGETVTLADVKGRGMIRHLWLTFPRRTPETLRSLVLRIYWDECETPSVEAPVGDFFGLAHGRTAHFSTPYLGVSEGKGFNCFFPMPFSEGFRITLENDWPERRGGLFYAINFTLGDDVTPEMGRFHAHFRRETPPVGENYRILETSGTPGVYVGTVIGALPRTAGTWREGDFRFFIDGDTDRPTIVGTGWSDWFLSGWGLGIHQSLYAGSTYQVIHPEMRNKFFCSCFRFHVLDPIYFQHDLRVEHTQFGEPRHGNEFSPRSDDWCSTAYWYQRLTDVPLPPLPSLDERLAGIAVPDWEEEALQRMRTGIDRRDDGA